MLQTIFLAFYIVAQVCIYIYLGRGQHSQVKLYVYLKLDYKYGNEFRRILFVLNIFISPGLPEDRFVFIIYISVVQQNEFAF